MIESFLSGINCIIDNKIIKPIVTPPVSPPVSSYITFADPEVERICIENWSSDGVGLTYEDAAAVTDLNGVFDYWSNNPPTEQITSFNELQYFTGLTILGESPDGNGQFSGAEQLTSIILPPNLTILENYTFQSCTKLTSIVIPNSVISIGNSAFKDCNELISVIVESLTPPIVEVDIFFNNANLTNIYVPAESVESYKIAPYWSDYAEFITAIV